jgi:hypothetical protein
MYLTVTAAIAIAPVAISTGTVSQASTHAANHTVTHAVKHTANYTKSMHINCAEASAMCTEVAHSDQVFGHYVGHDEPSMLF